LGEAKGGGEAGSMPSVELDIELNLTTQRS